MFDAFLTIYKAEVADLLRIASEGTGVLPAGQLHPDLVNRLADEAAKSARNVLNMCIRALDYCPPVDLTFGDYLRAIITADFEFDPVDEAHRRVAFVEAFRRHGIVPEDVRTLSVDGLLWRPSADAPDEDENIVLSPVREWAPDIASWNLTKDRKKLYELMRRKRAALHSYLEARLKQQAPAPSGIDPALQVEVHSIRPSFRTDWEGRPRFQWVIELTQRVPSTTTRMGRSRTARRRTITSAAGAPWWWTRRPERSGTASGSCWTTLADSGSGDTCWRTATRPGGHLLRRDRPRTERAIRHAAPTLTRPPEPFP